MPEIISLTLDFYLDSLISIAYILSIDNLSLKSILINLIYENNP